MKKALFAITAIAILSIASCKKEETAQPELKARTVADTKESGAGWDSPVSVPDSIDTEEPGAGGDNP